MPRLTTLQVQSDSKIKIYGKIRVYGKDLRSLTFQKVWKVWKILLLPVGSKGEKRNSSDSFKTCFL
jgi:hypothetical protein